MVRVGMPKERARRNGIGLLGPSKVLKLPLTRKISQERLKRFLALSQTIETMLEMYASFRDDLVVEMVEGIPVEPGPLIAELYRRKKLRVVEVRKRG